MATARECRHANAATSAFNMPAIDAYLFKTPEYGSQFRRRADGHVAFTYQLLRDD